MRRYERVLCRAWHDCLLRLLAPVVPGGARSIGPSAWNASKVSRFLDGAHAQSSAVVRCTRVTSTLKTFDAAQIRGLLQRMGALATARGADLDIVMLGGAAIALLFESRRITRDIDVVEAHPQDLLTELAVQIAKTEGLAPNWLSDDARRFVIRMSRGPLLVDAPGIRAHAVSLEQLLASKLDAMRDDTDRSDAVLTAAALGLAQSSAELAVAPYLRPERYERACQELSDIWQEVEDARR